MPNKVKPSINKRWGIIVPLIVLVLGIGGYFLYAHMSSHGTAQPTVTPKVVNGVNYGPANASDNASNEARKNSATASGAGKGSDAPAPTLTSPSTPPPFSATISRANPYSSNGSTGINVAATINGASTTGTCVFTLSPHSGQGQAITQSEAAEPSNSTYICPGLNISAPSGLWDVSVTVTVNNSSATAHWINNPVNT